MQKQGISAAEVKLAATLGSVIALRMLGLFMILPVFMVLAQQVPGFTPALGGLAMGIYGLTQAALQQPFGWLSDRWGRRPVLLLGMFLFALGGVVAAAADSMHGLVFGRALQGCGAVAGVAMAFAADFTRPQQRPLVMAIIGMGIGAAFLLSMVLSVPISNVLGLEGLFWLTAALGVAGMGLVLATPRSSAGPVQEETPFNGSMQPVWLLACSVFLLHAVMTLLFVVLPGRLVSQFGFALAEHWKLYLPTMLAAVLIMLPLLGWLGARRGESRVLPWSFAVAGLGLLLLAGDASLLWLAVYVVLYFVGFNVLEASMPALLARLTGSSGRGRRMGLYSTFQFLGAFAGGAGGGILLATQGARFSLLAAGAVCMAWAAGLAVISSRLFLTGQPDRL